MHLPPPLAPTSDSRRGRRGRSASTRAALPTRDSPGSTPRAGRRPRSAWHAPSRSPLPAAGPRRRRRRCRALYSAETRGSRESPRGWSRRRWRERRHASRWVQDEIDGLLEGFDDVDLAMLAGVFDDDDAGELSRQPIFGRRALTLNQHPLTARLPPGLDVATPVTDIERSPEIEPVLRRRLLE